MKITYDMPSYDKFEHLFKESYDNLIEIATKARCVSENLKELVICEDVTRRANNLVHPSSIFTSFTKEKEFVACARIFYNDGGYIMLVDGVNVNPLTPMFPKVILELILQIWVEENILNLAPHPKITYSTDGYESFLYKSIHSWFAMYKSQLMYDELVTSKVYEQPLDDFHIYTENFMRKVRRHHYLYQNDNTMLGTFELLFLEECYQLIKHVLSYHRYSKDLHFIKDVKLKRILSPIISQCLKAFKTIEQGKHITLLKLQLAVDKLLTYAYLRITPHADGLRDIKILDNPKRLFKDEVIDTEDRIVAFIDILGFKAIVKEYDSEYLSNILKDLHEALEGAIATSIKQITTLPGNEDVSEHLKYRMFSDCLAISLPYYDNETDLIIQFNSLSIIIKAYLQTMALKGFFVRGGIALGSYYSDDNMIFSGGLVKAYEIESKEAIYPRIVVDKQIVSKLLESDQGLQTSFAIHQTVLYDSTDNTYFINGFDLVSNIKSYADFLQNSMDDAIRDLQNDSDPLIYAYSNVLKSLNNNIVKPAFSEFNDITAAANESVGIIKSVVQDNIIKYELEPKVKTKYEWLMEYLQAIDKGFPTKRFRYVDKLYDDLVPTKKHVKPNFKAIVLKYIVAILISFFLLNVLLMTYILYQF